MMNKVVLFIFVMFLSGCDCLQVVNGTVVDSDGNPIEGVIVTKKNEVSVVDTTDMAGRFELSDVTGRNQCETMTVVLNHTNFQQEETTISNNDDVTIVLN